MRHGESDGNVKRILCGRTIPTDLTVSGILQVREVAEKIKDRNIELIYTSPIARTQHTATILSEATGVKVEEDERFIEIDVGSLAGRSVDDINREDKDWGREFYDESITKYGVEKFSRIIDRVRNGVKDISDRHPDTSVLVVTHMHPIKAAVALSLNCNSNVTRGLRANNASITIIEVLNGKMRLVAFNILNIHSFLKDR